MNDETPSASASSIAPSAERTRELRDAEFDRVVESERLKTAFLASLSHEFRTPLNVVLGYLDILEEATTPAEARSVRALIRRHAGSMLGMLDNTLYLADLRLERVVLESELFALPPLLHGVARETEVLWGRPAVPLKLDLDDAVSEIRADRRVIRQIVRNLLANALCFTEKGEVLLQTRALPELDAVEISVADTGPGIPVVDRDLLFDEYTALRTDLPGHLNAGLGIGLPVAKQLATLIGGTLEVESSEGWSSVFRFRFSGGTSVPRGAPVRAPAVERVIRPVSPRGTARGALRCPPFPAVLGMIARALQDPASDDRDVRRAIRSDEALSITLLNYANAASVPRVRPAQTTDEALSVVGLNGLRSIILTKFVHSLFTRWGVAEEFLWEHALASAIAAPRLGAGNGGDSEELYLCGLLHNVGKVLLNAEDPTRYADVLLAVSEAGEEFCRAEQAFFRVTHPAFGAELVRDAGIPAIVKDVVAYHHDSAVAEIGTRERCRVVLLADAIAYRVSPTWASLCGTREEPRWIAERIDGAHDLLSPEALASLLESVRTELEDIRGILRH